MALAVLLVADQAARIAELSRALRGHGLRLSGVAGDGGRAVDLCRALAPDLVLVDLGPGDDGLAAARLINRKAPRAVVLISQRADQAFIARAREAGAQACLPLPLGDGVLGPALELAHRGFVRERDLAQEVGELRENLRRRKLVERAKGVLMQRLGLNHAEAEARLNAQAAEQGLAPHQAAAALVAAADAPRHAGRRRVRPADPQANPA